MRVTTHLQGEQQEKGLHTIVSSINEVSQEEVVGVWALTTDLEELDEIVKLTVDVTADL